MGQEDQQIPDTSSASRPGVSGSAPEQAVEADAAVEQDLEALVADVSRERDEYLDLARRAQADFENYRKRAAAQVADASRKAKAELARELLPAIDSLERALEAARARPDADPGAPGREAEEAAGVDSYERGVAIVRDQLVEALQRAGVEAYDPVGERFDPAWHEALSAAPAPEGVASGEIVEVLDRGYRLDGQVLRPARVVVAE